MSVVNWPQLSHNFNLSYEFYKDIDRGCLQPQQRNLAIAWAYLSSSVSNPRVSLGLKHALLINRQNLSSTPAAHRSPWLHLIQQTEVWQRTRKITDIQNYFRSLTDGQQGWGSLQNSSACPCDASNELHVWEFAHKYHVLYVHKERTGAVDLTHMGGKFVAESELHPWTFGKFEW